MRISDWSSDVCSSDLEVRNDQPTGKQQRAGQDRSQRQHRHATPRLARERGKCEAVAEGDGRTGQQRGLPCPDRDMGRSEEHTSELQSLVRLSYAVFCLTTKNDAQPTSPLDNYSVILTT